MANNKSLSIFLANPSVSTSGLGTDALNFSFLSNSLPSQSTESQQTSVWRAQFAPVNIFSELSSIQNLHFPEEAMIKKVSGGYRVLSEKGKNLGGPYKTKKEAEKRLKQVEFFKHKKG